MAKKRGNPKPVGARKITAADPATARQALQRGQTAAAVAGLDGWLKQHPDDAEALHLRGVAALVQGQGTDAARFIGAAVKLRPTAADFHVDLGNAYFSLGEMPAAEQAMREALRLNPGHTDALFNLGNLLRQTKRLPEALGCYSALLERLPNFSNGWNNTGLALLDMGQRKDAQGCFEEAIRLDPRNVLALLNLGTVQHDNGAYIEAIATNRKGIAIDPNYVDLRAHLARSLSAIGRVHEAVGELRRALRLAPGNATAHNNLIFTLDYDPAATTAEQQAARRNWYRHCIAPLHLTPLDSYRQPDAERLLRIGYVSADFRATSAAMAFGPMIFAADRTQFQIFCYANSGVEDDFTAAVRASVDAFRVIAGQTDAEVAAQIAADRIDILVDLSGHMRGNRLEVFARRPAPLQGTAWGYANGTGMAEIDFIFVDPIYLPSAEAALFAEKPVYLTSVIPYRPLLAPPALAESPVVAKGRLTFGSFSRLQKISDASVKLWADVLAAVPDAELVLKASTQADSAALAILFDKFAAAGVAAERLRVLPNTPWVEHMESFAQIDIQLDPFPHGGGISLLDGIMMGVPSLTLAGTTPAGRLGAALLTALGLPDWVATTTADYVRIAAAWNGRRGELAALRQALRARLLASPVGDAAAYVGEAEAAYRRLWREKCTQLSAERRQRLAAAKGEIADPRTADRSLAKLEALLAADPQDTDALHLAGLAAYQLKNFPLAIELLRRAVALRPDFVDAWTDLGTALNQTYQKEASIGAFETALGLDDSRWMTHYNLGVVYLETGNAVAARRELQRADELMPAQPAVLTNLGLTYQASGDVQTAESFVRRALELDPGYAPGYQNLARFAIERDDAPVAVAFLEKALTKKTDNHRLRYGLRYELAVWYERLGMSDRLSALTSEPFLPGAPAGAGGELAPRAVFAGITRLVKSEAAAKQWPQSHLEELLMAWAMKMMELDHPGKIWLFEEVLALNPNNLDAHLSLGIAHYHDTRYAEARAAWGRGLVRRDELAAAAGLADLPQRILDSSWFDALGHLQMIDAYLKSVELGWRPKRSLWLLRLPNARIPNEAYFSYLQPWLNVPAADAGGTNLKAIEAGTGVPVPMFKLITDNFYADRRADGQVQWHMEFAAAVEREWQAQRRPPLLRRRDEDRDFGAAKLRELGVPDSAWFVCIHVREPGFWQRWDRHHASIRNAHIDSYFPAMQAIVGRGGWVIRMGDTSMRRLPPLPGVIDYAHSPHKSARMDVFLWASCRFFVGVNSGPSLLPPTFGVPCLLTNFTPISIPFPSPADLMLPKLFRHESSGRLLSLDEMYATGVAHAQFAAAIPDGIEVVDNTAEDIVVGVEEMLDRLDGKLTADDAASRRSLQAEFAQGVLRHGGFLGSPIGAGFWRRYRDALVAD